MSDIPYSLGKNYFVSNQIKHLDTHKITSQSQFDVIFGSATTMNNFPTPIDFDSHFVIAVIQEFDSIEGGLSVDSLKKSENKITLNYTITRGGPISYSSRMYLIVIVDKQYDGDVEVVPKDA